MNNHVDQPCQHTNITGMEWPDGGWVDYCNDCGLSRYCWEQEDGEWQRKGDLEHLRAIAEEVKDVLEKCR